MKIKESYQIMNVMNNYVLIDTSNVNSSIIKLNDTSKDIVELLIKDDSKEDILKYMLDNYDIDIDTLNSDYDSLIESLRKANAIDD